MLEGLIGDMGFAIGSQVSDSLSTLFASRNGDTIERNVELRKSMNRYGVASAVLRDGIKNTIKFGIYGLAFYGTDNLIGIEDNTINLHHALLYGNGVLKYYISVVNIAAGLGLNRLNKFLSIPFEMTLGGTSSYKKPRYMILNPGRKRFRSRKRMKK